MEESVTSSQSPPLRNEVVAEPHAAPKRSRGEKLFDWLVYGGIAGVGAFLATIKLTMWFTKGNGKTWTNGITNAVERGLSRVLPGKIGKNTAEQITMTTMLMQGGNVMLIPVGIAEYYKEPLINKANAVLGDKTPKEMLAPTSKQTLLSLIEGRITAWVVVFASLFGASQLFEKTFNTFKTEFAELTCKLFKSPTHQLEHGVLKPSKAYEYGKIGALDVFATAAAATLLYVAGHLFAKRHEEKIARRPQNESHKKGWLGDETLSETSSETLRGTPVAKSEPESTVLGVREHQGQIMDAGRAAAL